MADIVEADLVGQTGPFTCGAQGLGHLENWAPLVLNETSAGVDLLAQEDGSHETVITRNPGPTLDLRVVNVQPALVVIHVGVEAEREQVGRPWATGYVPGHFERPGQMIGRGLLNLTKIVQGQP